MNVLIVLAHPESASFNTAMAKTAAEVLLAIDHKVQVSDLYAMKFWPVSDRSNFNTTFNEDYFKPQQEERYASENGGFSSELESEIIKIENCDLMIWQFPLWWFSVPAILKGWIDRALPMGRAYGRGRMYKSGMFTGKRAMLSLTTGAPLDAYQNDGFQGSINAILWPIHRGILEFVGFDVLRPHIVYDPASKTRETLCRELEEFHLRLQSLEQEKVISPVASFI